MRKRWILIALVVAVAIAAEVAISLVNPFHGPENELLMFLFAMLPSHGSLLAFWAALGGRASPWRLVVAVVGVVAWMWVLKHGFTGDSPYPDEIRLIWVFVLFSVMCLISALLMVARFFGAELTDVPADASDQPAPPQRRWEQFSLGSLLSWTTATALLLGSLHYLPKKEIVETFSFSDPSSLGALAAIMIGSALIALGAIWITLGTRWTAARYVVLLAAGIGAGGLLFFAAGPGGGNGLFIFCFAQVFWVTGSLWLVRMAGYRLIWRRRVRL